MQMTERTHVFSASAVSLSILTAALVDAAMPTGSVRSALLFGILNTALLSVLVWAIAALVRWAPAWRKTVAALLALGILAELFQTALQAQAVCRDEFRSMALVGVLPLLLWAGGRLTPGSWNAAARVLWWLFVLGAVLCLPGLLGQMHWARLVAANAALPSRNAGCLLYAEYVLLPLLCPEEKPQRAMALPWLTFAVQAALWLGIGLVLGANGYPQQELLRAWSTGMFSRLDAFLILIWLAGAFYRLGFLCTVLRVCLRRALCSGKEAME